jgi:LuxR family maltose regulon positive regulatory protein
MSAHQETPSSAPARRREIPRPLAAGLVERPRLLARMASVPDGALLLVAAPAGYGKTTVLSEWAAEDPRAVAWISLGERHDDPALLLASIAEALAALDPIDPAVTEALEIPLPSIEGVVLPRLAAALEGRRPFVLVLDDVHLLASEKALAVVAGLLDCLPAGSQLALAARVEPALSLGRLRASRRLVELDRSDLAMTHGESGRLYGELGLELSAAQLDAVMKRTEGWPAALYLAGLALGAEQDLDRALAEFAGDDRFVVDYLRDVFLAGLPPADLRFTTRISILDRLSGPLCDAVLGGSGSGRRLQELSRSNLLLTPLDHRDEWFRFHGLLREMLISELRRVEAEAEPDLHRRASAWYSRHDDPDRAIDHAIAAGDPAAAGDLIWDSVPYYNSRGRVATIERWLERFDEGTLAAHAGLALAAAQSGLTRGDGETAERWIAVAEAVSRAGPERADPLMDAGALLARATTGREGVVEMGRKARRAYDLYPEDSPWRSLSCLLQGVSVHLSGGDSSAARALLEEGTRRAAVAPNVQALCLSQHALLAMDSGEQGATELVLLARAQLDRYGLWEYPTVALVIAVLAWVRARDGQVEAAAADAEAAARLLAKSSDLIWWFDAEARIILARAYQRLGDAPRARELLAEAERRLAQTPDAVLLAAWLQETRAGLDQAAADTGLTRAELRVLQFLPTHLSFREIAERTHVSPNTVKTQAQAIYRKLEVTARAEAVDAARSDGLLREDDAELPG